MHKLFPIYLLALVNTLSFSILLPVLPFLVEEYGGSHFHYGLLLSAFGAAQFIGAPILGSLSDRVGRKKILLLSQFGTFVSWALFGFALGLDSTIFIIGSLSLPLFIMLLARLFDGITGGNNSVAEAYITDITSGKDRAKFFGILGAIFGIGMILGPVTGSLLFDQGVYYLIGFELGLSLITFVALFFFLRDTDIKKTKKIRDPWWHKTLILKRIKAFDTPLLQVLFRVQFWFCVLFTGYTSIILLYLIDRYNLDAKGVGILLLGVGGISIINQAFLLPRFVLRLGEYKVLQRAHLFLFIGIFLLPWAHTPLIFFLFYTIAHLGVGAIFPPLKALVTHKTDSRSHGEVLGILEGIMSFTTIFVPLLSTFLYSFISEWIFCLFAIGFLGNYFYLRFHSSLL